MDYTAFDSIQDAMEDGVDWIELIGWAQAEASEISEALGKNPGWENVPVSEIVSAHYGPQPHGLGSDPQFKKMVEYFVKTGGRK